MIEFPADPETGQQYVADNAVTYTWRGTHWSSAPALEAGTARFYLAGGRAATTYFDQELDGGTAQG